MELHVSERASKSSVPSELEAAASVEREPLLIRYDPDLPITQHRTELIRLIEDRQAIIVCGATGSGKSTQLPKLCLEAGRGTRGWIGHTQPRRLAASSIARRLAEEMESPLGEVVGYKVRFNDRTRPTTRIKVMTDGILLAEISSDRKLRAYDTLIIDEAHERSLNIDLLMGYLRLLCDRRPELRLIITSATIDAKKFSDHFSDALGPAPIVEIAGRTYPVEIKFLESSASSDLAGEESAHHERLQNALGELLLAGSGDILVFLPTEREIRDATKQLRGWLAQVGLQSNLELLPLYARLTESEQQRIFRPHDKRRIVLATNVAESSLTVPGIRYVIDSGTARISRYAPRTRVQRLPIEPISQASANQRAGRCGRLGPGICIRLYTEQDFLSRAEYNTPEIKRTNLAGAILLTKSLGLGQLHDLPLLDSPRPEAIRDGMAVLRELGAIDELEELTPVGRQLARWPVDPQIGKIILEANNNGVLSEILIIASALEVQDPRLRPPERKQDADDAHRKLRHEQSDFLSFLLIWDYYHDLKEELGRSRLEKACKQNYLSLVRLREWADVHRQLLEIVTRQGLHPGKRKWPPKNIGAPFGDGDSREHVSNTYTLIHQSLLSGLLSGVAINEDGKKYKGPNGLELELWPGSGLRNRPPKWIVASELVETEQRFARTAARIEPEWLTLQAAHLLKHSYDQPHFSSKHGSAMVARKSSLFGLPLGTRTLVPLAPLDPVLARRLLIDEGLVEGKLKTQAWFARENARTIEECKQLAHRTRQRAFVVDPFRLQRFYDANIPAEVVDRRSLELWDRELAKVRNSSGPNSRNGNNADGNRYWPYLTIQDLTSDNVREDVEVLFPSAIRFAEVRCPIVYQFEPGKDEDGITLIVLEDQMAKIDINRLDWLVPGRLEEKIEWLLRSMKKDLRREFMPIAETARKLAEGWIQAPAFDQMFLPAFCKKLSEIAGRNIASADMDFENLPNHLRMRVEVRDSNRKKLRAGRDLKWVLYGKNQATIETTASDPDFMQVLHSEPWYRDKMTKFDIDELPTKIVGHPRIPGTWYVTFKDHGNSVSTELVESEVEASRGRARGLLRCFLLSERRELRSQVKHLPNLQQSLIWMSSRIDGDRFQDDLVSLMARLAFMESSGEIVTIRDYQACLADRIAKISIAAQEIVKWLPRMAQSHQEVSLALQQLPKAWGPTSQAIHAQLSELFPAEWFLEIPWENLREYPRYFQAILGRIARLRTGGIDKDLACEQQVQRFLDAYRKLEKSAREIKQYRPLQEFRWMIEEFRVSLFAQQLGTRVPVSEKRLSKVLTELEGAFK